MLTAQDMSYDEARNLHSKWLKHQAFMAELASNKEWLDKIEKVSENVEGAPPTPFSGLGTRENEPDGKDLPLIWHISQYI